MTLQDANSILSKFGIEIDEENQLQLLIKIMHLPTSQIEQLFNDLSIFEVFDDERKYLF